MANSTTYANGQTGNVGIDPFCGGYVQKGKIFEQEENTVTRLEIDFKKRRKWTKNSLKIIKSNADIISKEFKKKFKGTVIAHYSNGNKCSFKAKIRQSGDNRDHIALLDGRVVNSLDIRLIEGHLMGVVRFKLFIPATREGKKEVILTSLMKAAGFLVPRTKLLPVNLMGVPTTLLFQERPAKELLEANGLREGPLLEGDERFGWSSIVFDDSRSFSLLANPKWAAKGDTSLSISQRAVEHLDAAYIKQKFIRHKRRNESALLYLDNQILANGNKYHLARLNEFDALLTASIAAHAFYPNNRKFYYDPMYGYFHPIYYDGNAAFGRFRDLTPEHILKSAVDGAERAIETITNINTQEFLKTVQTAGAAVSRSEIEFIFQTLIRNLKDLRKFNAPDFASVVVPKSIDYLSWGDTKIPNASLVRSTGKDTFELCPISGAPCTPVSLSLKDRAKLLGGGLQVDNIPVLFQSSSLRSVTPAVRDTTKKFALKLTPNTEIITSSGIRILEDTSARSIIIRQETRNDWVLFRGGSLSGLTIVFEGASGDGTPDAKAQRFNTRGITGCLTLVDLSVNRLRLQARQVNCEDGINLVRINGKIESVIISDAASDALDVDFSNIEIEKLNVRNAGNDCADFSAGKVSVKSFMAINCGDKGLSVGEGARIDVGNVKIEKSVTAVASKDSSRLSISKLEVKESEFCVLAYRKKQEFSGSMVRIFDDRCAGAKIKSDIGSDIAMGSGS